MGARRPASVNPLVQQLYFPTRDASPPFMLAFLAAHFSNSFVSRDASPPFVLALLAARFTKWSRKNLMHTISI